MNIYIAVLKFSSNHQVGRACTTFFGTAPRDPTAVSFFVSVACIQAAILLCTSLLLFCAPSYHHRTVVYECMLVEDYIDFVHTNIFCLSFVHFFVLDKMLRF